MTYLPGAVLRGTRIATVDGDDVALPFDLGVSHRGRSFHNGIGPVSVGVGEHLRFYFKNPVGSGRVGYVNRLRFFSDSIDGYLEVRINPTTGLPATQIPSVSQRAGAPNGLAQLFGDVSAVGIGGGGALGWQLPITRGDQNEFQIPGARVIPAGVGISVDFANDAESAGLLSVALDWHELDS